MDKNFSFLNSISEISEATFKKLLEAATLVNVEAGNQLIKADESPSKVYLLISGFMRAYLSSETGKEYNKKFFLPYNFVASLTALIKNEKSRLTYETLTDCQLYEMNFEVFMNFVNTDLSICKLYVKTLEGVFMDDEKRQLEFISMNATQRYLALKKEISDIDSLIPQYQIASYLSITPVQLCRIRKKLNANY
ncbi:hypothetical protein APS56_16130 [Pseudalgibacter alginicilyticus]|uniref:Cyclic nucleotide-binding domain-containing protein n=1 Tax=Pseudalgibacter alginicilyticus TaxID=1736674 RepID=A0A0P0D0T2_9FLAO|nr:Crp/Fnr family transcriptional regulator [Pseudalgibacter alginicilyticus]ALJ06568.1 hypothetical protein APS56_16130 [Pseudalgibacter alginicilyticus]